MAAVAAMKSAISDASVSIPAGLCPCNLLCGLLLYPYDCGWWQALVPFSTGDHRGFLYSPSSFSLRYCKSHVHVTMLENLKLCPKIQYSEKFKIVNLNFSGKKQWFLRIFKCQGCLDNVNFRAKIFCVSTEKTKIENCCNLTIFDVKIQIMIEVKAS